MITLREAKEQAEKMTDRRIPSISSLTRWAKQGILDTSLREENLGKVGGRRGLYWDGLPVEIATACEIKGLHELDRVAWAAKILRPRIKKGDDFLMNEKDLREVIEEGDFEEAINEAGEFYSQQEEIVKELNEIFEMEEAPEEVVERLEALKNIYEHVKVYKLYIEVYADKLEKYNKLPEVELKKAANDS